MDFKFLNNEIDIEHITLPLSDKIHQCLLENNTTEIQKGLKFLEAQNETFLYIHGFIGTGKRQYINYLCEFINNDVIKLEYYCKEATVCDDILLDFTDRIEKEALSKSVDLNAKITTLENKFQKQIRSIKKPFLIILNSLDNITDKNIEAVIKVFSGIARENNVKIIISTKALKQNLLGEIEEDSKIYLKAFTKDIFTNFVKSSNITATDKQIEEFYSITRGYYYYTAISIKIIQAMKISLTDFLQKLKTSEMTFDSYIGLTYINLIPQTIKNFFWFIRTIRHGLTLNSLAEFEIYDEFSIEYLKANLIIFQVGETIYLHDYFAQKIDMLIPNKTAIKLHKYIIGIYEKLIKEPLSVRTIFISRQCLRAEIEFHNQKIKEIESEQSLQTETASISNKSNEIQTNESKTTLKTEPSITEDIQKANDLMREKKYTDAIELLNSVLDNEKIGLTALVDVRHSLAKLYKETADYTKSEHYYELVETYYQKNKEFINLNYLYYETSDLYYKMYRHERAIETIKKVIYSVDTPQSLLVQSCIMLGNIYSDLNNPEDAFVYYQKAIESIDDNVEASTLAELYFKYALGFDDKENYQLAYEYYDKCINTSGENNPFKSLAYSNLASCYMEQMNYDDALNCFKIAYDMEKQNNNFEGIYYTSFNIAKIYLQTNPQNALKYLKEAKQSAEFINESFYILESSLAIGDYYYNIPSKWEDALKEYFRAKNIAEVSNENLNINKIMRRINDMKLRMNNNDFKKIEEKYDK